MTEYKLVPYEPTPAMVEAAEEAHMPFGDMDIALRMAVLAAPEQQVEQEPVGEIVYEFEPHRPGGRVYAALDGSKAAVMKPGTKLYAGPQEWQEPVPVTEQQTVQQARLLSGPPSERYWQDSSQQRIDYLKDKEALRASRGEPALWEFRTLYTAPPAAPDTHHLIKDATVSVDVSTGDHDAGNRLFGKVCGVQGTGKDMTILVCDTEANFTEPAAPDVSGLIEALGFYARREHLALDDEGAWDTVTDEPQNWLYAEDATATVEDGSIAEKALSAYREQQGGDHGR